MALTLPQIGTNILNRIRSKTAPNSITLTEVGDTLQEIATLADSRVATDDVRLSDARAPLAHTQAAATVTGLAVVATSGSYTDLTNKPIAAGLPVLATVATTGSYTDLTSKPVIPAAYTDAQAVAANTGSITANTTAITNEATARAAADTALQAQEATNATNIATNTGNIAANVTAIALKVDKVTGLALSSNDYTSPEKAKLAALATVATSGSYTDLVNKPILAVPDTFSVMPYAASVVVDFNLETVRTLAATGNIAFGPSLNTALLKTKEHYITNTTAAAITLSFPAGWVFVPGPAPTTLAAGKLAILSLMSLGTSDSTIKAAYVAQV